MSIEKFDSKIGYNETRIKEIQAIFPEVFKEGKINFEKLYEELVGLDDQLVEDNEDESFEFKWVGKRAARKLAFSAPEGTLKLTKGDGLNDTHTRNLCIEGDNLKVLRLLQNSYKGKIKLIYIDPPYNTGNDFVYKDDFKESTDSYLRKSGQLDEEGYLTSNPKSHGRYHTNWLNMMYPRLKLARNLLKDDGVIFVSIDDNEQANLKKIMDEIFGEDNFVTNIVWQKNYAPRNDALYFSDMHDFILVYTKRKKTNRNDTHGWSRNLMPRSEKQLALYKNRDVDPRGAWKADNLTVKSYSAKYDYPITTPSGRIVNPPVNSCWRVSKERFEELVKDNRIWFGENGGNVPALKRFLSEVQDGAVPVTWWKREDSGDNQEATQELRSLFADTGVPFETPKPVRLIKRILQLATNPNDNDIILDFFAGSGTTPHAVLEMNKEDNGNRQFIAVQVPEEVNYPHYSTIAEVTKERIRRVINKLNNEDHNALGFDRGFAVYKYYKKSNFKEWNSTIAEDTFQLEIALDDSVNNVFNDGVIDEDVVTEIMLNEGFSLSSRIIREDNLNTLWHVTNVDISYRLIICLDNYIQENTLDLIINEYKDDIFICLDTALTSQQKIILSEKLKVKII